MTEPWSACKTGFSTQLVLLMRTVPPKPSVASGLAVVLLVNCPLKRTSEPGARFQVGFCTVTFTPCAMMFVPAELVSGPFNANKFPFSVKPLLANVSAFNRQVGNVVGVVLPRRAAENKGVGVHTGAVPPSWRRYSSCRSAPAPDQVRTAACAGVRARHRLIAARARQALI